MKGLMMDRPLMISSIIEHAALYHGDVEIVSRTADHPLHRYTYRDAHARAQQLANALTAWGIKPGDRVATLAWNDFRHYEIYFGAAGIGAVVHTVNPRLFPDQLVYIMNHAADRILFVDPMFAPLVASIRDQLTIIEQIYVLSGSLDEVEDPGALPGLMAYEDLIAGHPAEFAWPLFDENTACGLCYTSGTTGNPKGVLYSHRSTLLHTLVVGQKDVVGLSSRDTLLPVVPMFHANAWGLVYLATMSGSKQVLPGKNLDGESLYRLFEDEGVTLTAGVPTVWMLLLGWMKENGKTGFTTLEQALIGGAAAPRAMIEAFETVHGVTVCHAWGMTEMSPVGTTGSLKRGMDELPVKRQHDFKATQGHTFWGVELKIADDDGNTLPRDGEAFGNLYVRGPYIASGYFGDEDSSGAFDQDGWFRTGDVATLDSQGWMRITDRSKDVIKSGGEWISSIQLENAAMGHPGVKEAAVIGVAHPKWDERPLLIIVPDGDAPDKDSVLEHLAGQVAKWWLPDAIAFVEEIPHTATGKIQKIKLREQFSDYSFPGT